MKLVEQHIIKSNDPRYKDLWVILHNSKNLYNYTLFVIRQHYFNKTGKQFTTDIAEELSCKYVDYYKMDKLLKQTNNPDYKNLPANTSQEILKDINESFKSFFKLNDLYNQGKITDKPNIPKYKNKEKGLYQVVYNKMTFCSQKSFIESGEFYLPKNKNLKFKIQNYKTCSQIRFIPRNNYIIMEVIYEKEELSQKMDNQRYMAIDLGVSNLATCSSNVISSFIINGKPVKSINQYYNKQYAEYKSKLDICQPKQYMSKRLYKFGYKRYMKIKDYFHKASKYIVNELIINNIHTLIIGKNDGWKQEVNNNHINNQNFVYIPFNTFIDMLSYKCKLHGIQVIIIDESYTSKCNFFGNDYIPTYGKDDMSLFNPTGYRAKRGLYKVKGSKLAINADVNASLNIMRKYLNVACDEIISPTCRGFMMNPVKITLF